MHPSHPLLKPNMRDANIPHTDLNPSVICLGTGGMGTTIDRDASFKLLDAFVEAGGNFLDTAKVYSDWIPGERSRSEKTLGAWMRARGNRSQIVLATKGAHPNLQTMDQPRLKPEDITGDIKASLSHLQADVIDLYWLHRDDPAQSVASILDTLNAEAKVGHIRYFGCSNWKAVRIQEADEYAARTGQSSFAANQMLWNAAAIDLNGVADKTLAPMDKAMYELHMRTHLAAVPFSSQANGLFSKWSGTAPDDESGAAAGPGTKLRKAVVDTAKRVRDAITTTAPMYSKEANLRRLAVIEQIAEKNELTVSQVVLGYLLAQPFPTFPIVGCRHLGQLLDSLSAADVQLDAEEVAAIEQA